MEQPSAPQPPAQPPTRPGGRKWMYGCLAAVVVGGLCAALAWHLLARWDRGLSAWEHLPPSTEWAAEAHDVKFLLDRAAAEPGIRRLLRRYADRLADSDASGSRLEDLTTTYRSLSFASTFFMPNIVLAGEGARDLFLVVRPSPLIKLLVGGGDAVAYSSDMELHHASRDGWLVLSESEAQVEDILAHWDDRPSPFGSAPGTDDAYLVVGVRREGGGGPAPAPSAPGMLAVGNPFAPPAAPAGAASVGGLLLLPKDGAWELFARVGSGAANVKERVAAELPEAVPQAVAGGGCLEAAARLSPEAAALLRAELLRRAEFPSGLPHSIALGRHWLREQWLGRIGDGLTLLAGEPGTGADGCAPLPRAALGWRWNGGPSPDGFADGLTVWLDAMGAPGGGLAAEVLRCAARYEAAATPDGRLVTLLPPAPLFNGATPTWLVENGRLGWLGSDAPAIPDKASEAELLLGVVPEPGPGRIRCQAAWNASPGFRDGLAAFLAERLHGRNAWLAQVVGEVFAAFPRGGAAAEGDATMDELSVHAVLGAPASGR